jgi:hypothetical protein
MMPSSRAEVRVVGHKSAAATLRTALYFTGGDSWPGIDLARVNLTAGGKLPPLVARYWPAMPCRAPAA